MTNLRKAAEMALDTLDAISESGIYYKESPFDAYMRLRSMARGAIEALRTALAQPEQRKNRMTDQERKVMEMVLEALEWHVSRTRPIEKTTEAIEALRTALAQPEQDDEAYGYAKYLAECIWKKHYKEESPHWRPSDNTLSVLTQIDNMTCGLEKAQPEQEPVALKQLREVHEVQGLKGNWDFDPYMRGLYNGLELALSLFEKRDPVYKETNTGKPVQGFKLVPRKPTREMVKAMQECSMEGYDSYLGEGYAMSIYTAAVDEAKEPPISEPVENLEPVACIGMLHPDHFEDVCRKSGGNSSTPLYTAPPKREWEDHTPPECKTDGEKLAFAFGWWKALEVNRKEWVGLTDEQIAEIAAVSALKTPDDIYFARLIEAMLKEKNA